MQRLVDSTPSNAAASPLFQAIGEKEAGVPKSVLEAIKQGITTFEPKECRDREYDATGAIPGTRDKVDVLAERAAQGLPLWHPEDRADYEGLEAE